MLVIWKSTTVYKLKNDQDNELKQCIYGTVHKDGKYVYDCTLITLRVILVVYSYKE
jgi:hypothetical protein